MTRSKISKKILKETPDKTKKIVNERAKAIIILNNNLTPEAKKHIDSFDFLKEFIIEAMFDFKRTK